MDRIANALFKIAIVACLLLASGSVAYYYLIYLPQRDARLDAEGAAAAEQRAAEKSAIEQHKAAEKVAAQIRYQACLDKAAANYTATWASDCKAVADRAIQDYATCTAGRDLCERLYGHKDPSPNCGLPSSIADTLNVNLHDDRERCLKEFKAGLD